MSPTVPDRIMVENLRKGKIEAFDQIFNSYGNRLYGFVLSYLKSKEETEELVQDVFLKVWENRKKIKTETSLKSYLFTIAYHDLCKHFRRKKLYEGFVSEKLQTAELSLDLEKQLEYKETLDLVDRLVEQLPEKQKQIFIKSRKEGKTTREIADEMQLAPGTVDNNISAALKFLREHISNNNLPTLLFFAIFIA